MNRGRGLKALTVGFLLAARLPAQQKPGAVIRHPAITMAVSDSFTPLLPLRFPIEDLTDAERRIFVRADHGRVVRQMVVAQFETVKSGSTFRFVYRPVPPIEFGRKTYRFGGFAYDDVKAASDHPGREAQLTRRFLVDAGYRPPRIWKVVRLARVADDRGLSEVILFYLENGDREFPAGRLPGVDESGDAPLSTAEQERLLRRLREVVRPMR